MTATSRVSVVAVLILAGLCMIQRVALIDASLPYPRHEDEPHCSHEARRILRKGTFEPSKLAYPTLPIYLTATGMVAGYFRWASKGEAKLKRTTPPKIGNVGFPFYDQPVLMRVPRLLFAGLSALAVLLTSLAILRLSPSLLGALLGAGLMAISPHYMKQSWEYLNVDIVGAFFTSCLVYALVRYWDSPRHWLLAAWLGGLVGFAAGSKYTNGVQLIAVFACLALRHPGRVFRLWGLAAITAGLAFVASVPYAVLNLPKFLTGLGYEVYHYAALGHGRWTAEPGWPHFVKNVGDLAANYGWTAMLLAIVGMVWLLWKRSSMGVVLCLLLALPLYLLSQQRTHFVRNLLPVMPVLSVLVGLGVPVLLERLQAWLQVRAPRLPPKLCAASLVLLSVALTVPWSTIATASYQAPESRRSAADWVRQQVSPGSEVGVEDTLGFDPRTLAGYRVSVAPRSRLLSQARPPRVLVLAGRASEVSGLPTGMQVRKQLGRRAPGGKRPAPNPRLVIAH